MSSSSRPADLPLTGGDCFLRAFDAEARGWHRSSHCSQLVLRLGPDFDPAAFRERLAEVVRANPILRAPIVRPWGVAPPVYRLAWAERCAPPRVELHQAPAPPPVTGVRPLPEVFFARLNDVLALRRGELLRFDVVRWADGRSDLAMTWAHMLFDGSGSERFVAWLERIHRGERRPDDLSPDEAFGASETAGDGLPEASFRERGRVATLWQSRMKALGARAPGSLAGPRRRVRQRLRYTLDTLGPEETARVVARARERAGFLTPVLFYLAAAIRAHDAIFRKRGLEPGSYVVPLPVNLRPRGKAAGALFRSHVSILWFQVTPDQVQDFAGLVAELKEQRLASIKAGLVEHGAVAMDMARYAPKRCYAWMARRMLRGEAASCFFAFTNEFLPETTSFFGAPIENGFHAPAVMPSPGSGAIMSLREGRLNLAHVHQEGVLADDERALLRERLLADLLGG